MNLITLLSVRSVANSVMQSCLCAGNDSEGAGDTRMTDRGDTANSDGKLAHLLQKGLISFRSSSIIAYDPVIVHSGSVR